MRRLRSMAASLAAVLSVAFVLSAPQTAAGAVQLKIVLAEREAPEKEPVFAVKAEGSRIIVQVTSASYNCCYVADARLELGEGRVEIHERNVGTVCDSLVPCFFDVTYTVSRLEPGTYEVSLFGEDSRLLVKDTVELGAIVSQSECADEAVEKEKVVGSATHDSIVIEHRAAHLPCCLEFAPRVEIDGSLLRITALDANPAPCICDCYLNLAVEIPGLAPDTYTVRYIGLDGSLALQTSLVVAPPRVRVTQAPILRTAELPQKRTSVFVEGDDVVVEYVATVEQCCLDLDAWAELKEAQDPVGLEIRAKDNGPPCDCIGPYILRFEVLDLPAGSYRVACGVGDGATGDATVGAEEVFFIRGFVLADDWEITITDAIQTLGYLFLGSPTELPCLDAADSNDDGAVDLADAVYLLGYLFLGGPEPPAPFLWRPGLDPTADDLGCEGVPCDPRKLAYERRPGGPWDFVEFCMPTGQRYQDEVSEIYPEAQFLPGSHGLIGCTDDEVLCIIEWPDVNRSRLCCLTGRDYIREIRGSHWE